MLIDAGPDLREQLIDADVRRLDGVLITHPHADHVHGIDDLRPLYHTRARPHRHPYGRADRAQVREAVSLYFRDA